MTGMVKDKTIEITHKLRLSKSAEISSPKVDKDLIFIPQIGNIEDFKRGRKWLFKCRFGGVL